MKSLLLTPLLLSGTIAAQEEPDTSPKLAPAEAKRQSSLALGYQEGLRAAQKQMRADDFDKEAFLQGFLLGLKKEKLSIGPEEIRESMGLLQAKLTAREAVTAAKNQEAEKQFFEANREQKGIIETESGLQYRVVAAGEGSPLGSEGLIGKEILVNYRGTLPDGTEFVSSGEITPAKLSLNDLIAGFREALALMKLKSKAVIFIPSGLAYGDQRRSSLIGPNQMLIFEVELVEVRTPSAGGE